MYRTMEGTHYKNPELAIEAVLNGFVENAQNQGKVKTCCNRRSLKAFIWDSSRLEFEAARQDVTTGFSINRIYIVTCCRDCDLITAGELFGRSGYGVGLQKGSPWADKITLAILDYHESKYSNYKKITRQNQLHVSIHFQAA